MCGQAGVLEGALISLLLKGFLLSIVMQIPARGGEMLELTVEYILCTVSPLFPDLCQCLLTPPLLCSCKRIKSCQQLLQAEGPAFAAEKNICIFFQLRILGLYFLQSYLCIDGLRANLFYQPMKKLFTWSKNPHTCPCRRPLVSYEVWTKVSSCGIFSQWEFNSEHSAPFVSHWSASMGFRLFPFKHLNK